jgi:hypothetical protein
MDVETIGFVIGLIGAVVLKSSMNFINEPSAHRQLAQSMGREPENPALKLFVRGLILVLIGLGLETYARLLG